MGLCFSKKQRREEQRSNEGKKNSGSGNRAGKDTALAPESKKAPLQAKPAPSKKAPPKAEQPTADTRTVFVVKAAAAAAAAEVAAAASGEEDEERVKRAVPEEEVKPVVVSRVPVRTSSCTKEEVDAILIQCGRLSRSSSSSGKAAASGENGGGHHRRYSGSKRSYDFDRERRGGGVDDECDCERQGPTVSRPSPRRRTPERKRSGSHERSSSGGSGSRRVSRSPGRRADGAPVTASSGSGERASRQPGKMVSVPAREKGRAPSPVAAASGKRYRSPRSNSPARAAAVGNENVGVQTTHGPSLSRSSSRKAEHSPYRRNPMAELDENTLVNIQHHNNSNNGKSQKKPTDSAVAVPQKAAERAKDHVPSCRTVKDKPEIVEEAVASNTKAPSAMMDATHSLSIVADGVVNPRAAPGGRSSRRSSRDFDHNGNSYASLLLEDIQNYHQQNTSATAAAPTFSLPACVSKACSILEAVADLNSSSDNRSFELEPANDKGSVNGMYGGKAAAGTLVVESEVVVKDDLMEPSLHKYVSVRDIRGETEPQESAGSNSFAGNAWTCSWEPNSADSTDRTWTASQSNNGDEVEQRSNGTASPQEQSWQSKQRPSSQEPSGRSRLGSASNAQRGRSTHRGNGSVVSARSDVCTVSASS